MKLPPERTEIIACDCWHAGHRLEHDRTCGNFLPWSEQSLPSPGLSKLFTKELWNQLVEHTGKGWH